jgi:hypothetical protein
MENITAKQRLAFIRQDIARLIEQLPEALLETPIEGNENLGVVLNNIAIASDETDKEPNHWILTWYEVFRYEEDGTRSIAQFDTEEQALSFMYEYSMRYSDTDTNIELGYDEWQCNADGSGVAKRNPIN